MRLSIDLDDALIAEALAVIGRTSEQALVEDALRCLIRLKKEEHTLTLHGTVDWQGDLDRSRRDESTP